MPLLCVSFKLQSPHQEECCAYSGPQTSVLISWMCKKQTAVAHSSGEAEVVSLDEGFRLEGLPAVQLWECVLESFPKSEAQGNLKRISAQGNLVRQRNTCHSSVSRLNETSFAELYLFEDSEAVIRMIINGRSPNVRHVTRTHDVISDWSSRESVLMNQLRSNW